MVYWANCPTPIQQSRFRHAIMKTRDWQEGKLGVCPTLNPSGRAFSRAPACKDRNGRDLNKNKEYENRGLKKRKGGTFPPAVS
jgi:hypothetical protein